MDSPHGIHGGKTRDHEAGPAGGACLLSCITCIARRVQGRRHYIVSSSCAAPADRFQLPEQLRPPMFASIVAEHKDGREQQDRRTYDRTEPGFIHPPPPAICYDLATPVLTRGLSLRSRRYRLDRALRIF